MVALSNTFQGGTSGQQLSPSNTGGASGNAFDLITISSGCTATFTNAQSMHGTLAGAFATGSSPGIASAGWSSSFGTQTTHWGRLYTRLTLLPATTDAFIQYQSGNTFAGGVQITNTGLLSVQNSAFATVHNFTNALTTGVWYRFEYELINSATVGQIILSLYAGDSTSAIESYTSPASQNFLASLNRVLAGWNNSHANQPLAYVDDFALSTTGALGPSSVPITLHDAAGAAESFSVSTVVTTPIAQADTAAAVEGLSHTVSIPLAIRDVAAAADGIQVTIGSAPAPTPGQGLKPANPAFIRSQVPTMHAQNLLTGKWYHRDIQGISSPSITWTLNAADAFTCALAPPRPDMLDPTGNFLLQEWRDAIYLEENDEIKFGGILTQTGINGPVANLTAMGFAGYPNGMIYEGASISQTKVDALDAVRQLWDYLQTQPGGNLGLKLATTKAGFLIGNQTPPGASSYLYGPGPFTAGHTYIWVNPNDAGSFSAADVIVVNGDQYTIKTVEVNSSNNATGKIDLTGPLRITYATNQPVIQLQAIQPWTLNWYNSTDIGQEIASIQQEAIFDFREQHVWGPGKATVVHNLLFGVPRVGGRLQNLRFAEGENIVQAVQITRDGTKLANDVTGIGAGTGTSTIRANANDASTGRLRRSYVYTDQTVDTVARASAKAYKVLAAMKNVDTVTQVVVKNHTNAPFGSFGPGDDIPVMAASGWRNTIIWSRITAMTQDPTTDLMTLALARSDSFTYMAETGQAGTL